MIFLAYSGETRWRTSAGDELAARLGEPMTQDLVAQAWRTALDPAGDWMPQVLRAADARLQVLRGGGMPDAGGLVIATDQQTARAYAKLLERDHRREGRRGALRRRRAPPAGSPTFAASDQRWMVAVRMVSEGVDIPRLAVGVYATSASTPLYFAQAIGRFVRARRPGETATVFLPSVPHLLGLASEMEAERDHVLGAPKTKDGLRRRPAGAGAARPSRPAASWTKRFEALSATAELDQVIFDGASFGTAGRRPARPRRRSTWACPGCSAPDQVSVLLSRAAGRAARGAAAAPGGTEPRRPRAAGAARR